MHRSPSSRRGFTLLEIMIVTAIIGLLLSIAVPTFRAVRRNTQNTAFYNDVRTISGAMEQYATEFGVWPAASSMGSIPAGLEGALNDRVWLERNSLGGRFFIVRNAGNIVAAIGCQGHFADLLQIADLDSKVDDGSLISGLVQLDGERILYVLERN